MKIIAKNKKALHDYFILEKIEAGVELKGTEVKSIRQGNINIKDSILHIEKLYINKDNNKRKSIKTCENINHFYPLLQNH